MHNFKEQFSGKLCVTWSHMGFSIGVFTQNKKKKQRSRQTVQNGSKTILFGVTHTYVAYIREYTPCNHKNYNSLDCDWFKKLLFSTNSLAKLLSYSLLSDSSISKSHSKLYFISTSHTQSCSAITASNNLRLIFQSFNVIFPFFHNLDLLYSEIVIFMINW